MILAKSPRLLALAALAPLALGLAGCKKDDAATGGEPTAESTPIAKIAAPASKAWADVVDTTKDGGVVIGNPNAPIKVIEYGSLSCPHCAKLAQEGFTKLTGDYIASGRVSLEFRSFAIHPVDVPLTMLVRCGPKESILPLAEQIYQNFDSVMAKVYDQAVQAKVQAAMSLPENQRFPAAADAMGLTEFFAARGISSDQSHACLADFAKANEVAAQSEAYGKQGVDSTPTLFINGSKIAGNTWAELEAALQRAGAR